jgi:hypothetical protein
MPISDNEYNSLVGRLRERASELEDRYNDRNTILGNIGEKFLGYCISHSLWKLGYPIHFHNHPHSYLLKPKFGANDEGVGGVDFKLTIVNLDERRYRFLIEAKNWAHYAITPNMYRTQILERFTRLDGNGEYIRMITMNTRNIDDIQARCNDNNIHILPIGHHITLENLRDNTLMRAVFNNFIDNFIAQMRILAPEDDYPIVDIDESGRNRTQYVIRDLLLAVPYTIIEQRYRVSRRYIIRLASYIRSFNIPLPDRRRRDWRLQWEIQE